MGTSIPPAGGLLMTDYITTAGSNVTDLTISGLSGDTDGDYEITGVIIYPASAGGPGYYMRPFGASDTGLGCVYTIANASLVVAASNASNWFVTNGSGASDAYLPFYAYVTTKSGRPRSMWSRSQPVGTGIGFNNMLTSGYTTDTSTVISAITIHSSIAGAIKAGSWMKIRALQNNL